MKRRKVKFRLFSDHDNSHLSGSPESPQLFHHAHVQFMFASFRSVCSCRSRMLVMLSQSLSAHNFAWEAVNCRDADVMTNVDVMTNAQAVDWGRPRQLPQQVCPGRPGIVHLNKGPAWQMAGLGSHPLPLRYPPTILCLQLWAAASGGLQMSADKLLLIYICLSTLLSLLSDACSASV